MQAGALTLGTRDGRATGWLATLAAVVVLGLGTAAWARPDHLSVYRVEPGDTLYSIAARELGAGTRWTEIAQLNSLASHAGIRPGQILRLPGPTGLASDAAPDPANPHSYDSEPMASPAGSPVDGAGRPDSGFTTSRRYRGVEIVPRGRVILVLPAPGQGRHSRHRRAREER